MKKYLIIVTILLSIQIILILCLQQQQMSKINENRFMESKDKNQEFLRIIQNQHKEEEYDSQLINHINKLMNKFELLQKHQRFQWSLFKLKKCEELFSKVKLKELKFTIKILVKICNKYQIKYNTARVQELIKYIYLQKYGQQMVSYFEKVGYKISEYKFLHYQDPWYNKVKGWFGF